MYGEEVSPTVQRSSVVVERPLKILCVVGSFPLLPETFILNQLTGLIDRGHDVRIYAAHRGQRKVHPNVTKYKLIERAYYGALPPDLARYDIILCQFGPLGRKFAKIKKDFGLKAKVITCFRGYDISQEVQRKGRHVYDHLFKDGDLFLPVCSYFKDKLIYLGCDPKKIKVHHSAIDLNRFVFREKRKGEGMHVVSVNRLVPKKGTFYAIQAVSSLLKEYSGLRYSVLGDGHLKSYLEHLIRKKGAQHRIKLLGWGTQDDVIELLKTADVFVLPSLTAADGNEEGIPNAIKEAMATGIPVVSTFHAGIAELVDDGKTGFLVPSGDSQSLAQRIEYLLNNPEERRKMGVLGRKRVEAEYDTDKLNDRLIEIFYELLNA